MTSIHSKAKAFLRQNHLEKTITKTIIAKPRESENPSGLELAKFFQYRIKPFYKKQGFKICPIVFNLIHEALLNSIWHGGKNYSPHLSTAQIFATPTGLLSKHNDQGDYFQRGEIKEAWENRIKFPEKHKINIRCGNAELGTGLIYKVADFIYVDTNKGSLYLGTNTSNTKNFKKL